MEIKMGGILKSTWEMLHDGRFLKKALMIACPVALQGMLNTIVNMVDTLMIGGLGSTAIAAVGLANKVFFVFSLLVFGIVSGGGILAAQFWGSGDVKNIRKVLGLCVMLAMVGAMFFVVPALTAPRMVMRIFTTSEGSIELGAKYLRIAALSYPFIALTNVYVAMLRATNIVMFPLICSCIAIGLNICLNYVLIFGKLGAPAMGVAGAALSTLLSRVLCMVIIFVLLRRKNQMIVLDHYFKIRPEKNLICQILAISIPSGVENGMFQFGKLAIQSTVSTMGTTAIAAQAMTNIFENVNGVFGIGTGIGLMTVVGQCIGAKHYKEAKYYMVKLTVIAEVGLTISCLLVYAAAHPVTLIAGMEAESAALCMQMIAAITIVKPVAWVLSFVPAYGLRAAGDVRFSMIVSVTTMWCCRVALCIFLVKAFGMGPMAVWIGMFADWSIRSVIFSGRFLSGRWLKKAMN